MGLISLACLGCQDGGRLLRVTLRTDLVPGVELQSTRIVVRDPAGPAPPREQVRAVTEGADFIRGEVVGELEGLSRGRVHFELELLGRRGEVLVRRTVLVALEAPQQNVTVVVTRDCVGVMCPLAGDDPAAVACLGGRCVRPECTDENQAGCGAPQCMSDDVCPDGAACATGRCDPVGVCLLVADSAQCGGERYCQPELGCTPVPGTPPDGGRDAGLDGGPDAGADAGARDATADASAADRACPPGQWWIGGQCYVDDPRLSSLAVSVGTLTPTFGPDTYEYRVDGITLDDDVLVVTPAVADPEGATIYVDGSPVGSGTASVSRALALGETVVTVDVQAETGRQSRYEVRVRRPSHQRLVPTDRDIYHELGSELILTHTRLIAAEVGGSVRSYVDSGTGWMLEQTLSPLPGMASAFEGMWGGDHVPALSADAGILVVGDQRTSAGSMNVFELSAGHFQPTQDVFASNGEAGDWFGWAVDVSDDGQTVIVGDPREDGDGISPLSNALPESGAAYVYRWDGTSFVEEAYLKASNVGASDGFGSEVAISEDGTVAVVGAPFEDSDLTGPDNDNLPDSGATYVFRRVAEGWQEEALLKPSDATADGWAGQTVDISADGNVILVAGVRSSWESQPVRIFRDGGAGWVEEAQLMALHVEPDDGYGHSAALSADGSHVLVGAPWEQGNGVDPTDNSLFDAGAAYLFRREAGAWSEGTYVKSPSVTDGEAFGLQVAISPDGSRFAVSSPWANGGYGVIYLFP